MGTTHAQNSSKEVGHYWRIARYGGSFQFKGPEKDEAVLASLGIIPSKGANQGRYDDALFYDDNW